MTKPRRFFGMLCAHEWEKEAQSPILRASNNDTVGAIFLMRCKHCGDIKHHRVSV